MQTIIHIQLFTSLRLLRKVKFLLVTQGICHHAGRMNASLEQLTSSIKKNKMAKVAFRPDTSFRAACFFSLRSRRTLRKQRLRVV